MSNEFNPPQITPLPQHHDPQDPRVGLIKTIWGCSVGMLGICIPLVVILNNNPIAPFLPICIIAGATLSTLGIGMNKGLAAPKIQSFNAETAHQEQIRQLEERLANVEIMSSFERGMGERHALREAEATQLQPVTSEILAARSLRS